jgi:hypothetical protein
MTYIDHDLGPEVPARAPAPPVTTQRTQASPLLDLQRLAGNSAVSQAVKSGTFDPALPIQRLEGEGGESDEEEAQDQADDEQASADEEEMQEETGEEE